MTLREIVNKELICEEKKYTLEEIEQKIKEAINNSNEKLIISSKKYIDIDKITCGCIDGDETHLKITIPKKGTGLYNDIEFEYQRSDKKNNKKYDSRGIKRAVLQKIKGTFGNTSTNGGGIEVFMPEEYREGLLNKLFEQIFTNDEIKKKYGVDEKNKKNIELRLVKSETIGRSTFYYVYVNKKKVIEIKANTKQRIFSTGQNDRPFVNNSKVKQADKEEEKEVLKALANGDFSGIKDRKEETDKHSIKIIKLATGMMQIGEDGTHFVNKNGKGMPKNNKNKEVTKQKLTSNGADWVILLPDDKRIFVERKNYHKFDPIKNGPKNDKEVDPINPVLRLILYNNNNSGKNNSFSLGMYNEDLYKYFFVDNNMFKSSGEKIYFYGEEGYENTREDLWKYREKVDNKRYAYKLNEIPGNKIGISNNLKAILTFDDFCKKFCEDYKKKMNIYYIDISGGSKKEASDDLKKQGAYKPNDKNFEENLNIKEINSLPSIFTSKKTISAENCLKSINSVITFMKVTEKYFNKDVNNYISELIALKNKFLALIIKQKNIQPENFKTETSNKNITSKRNIHPVFSLNKKNNKNQEYGSVKTKYFNY